MSSTALRTFAFVLILLAVLFGAGAYYMNRQIEQAPDAQATAPAPEQARTLAVVAIRPLAPYQQITVEDVSLVPISVEPASYFTDTQEVVGRAPVRTVATGSPVTSEAFGRPNALAQAIPPGTQAMSLSISDVIAVGGFVQPGDFVDVLLYLRSSGDQVEDTQSRILLKDVRVLAYQEKLINEGSGSKGDNSRQRRERTAVVAVPEDDTTRVMLGASLGELRLALRAPQNREGAAPGEPGPGSKVGRMVASNDPGPGEIMPTALSPSTPLVAMDDDGHDEPGAPREQDAPEDAPDKERVITLKELARVEEKKTPPKQPKQRTTHRAYGGRSKPSRATIEVYEGSKASSVSRPY